jgi:hypothetical protein
MALARLSNIQRWEGQNGSFTAAESDAPGFVRAANVHHWAWTAGLGYQPHLWMGDTLYPFAFLDGQALFQRIVDTRAAQKFNHMRGWCWAPTNKPPAFSPRRTTPTWNISSASISPSVT